MIWSLLFAGAVLLVVVLKYLRKGNQFCPQCNTIRDGDRPLCGECGWIYDSGDESGEEDDGLDYGEPYGSEDENCRA